MKTDLTENKSTESGKSPVSMALKEWYYGDLWEKILDDWLKKNNNNANRAADFYKKPQHWRAWFGKTSSMLRFVMRRADESIYRFFPNSIRSIEQLETIDMELDYLMPENIHQIADILPVLATCYYYNYKRPYAPEKHGESMSFAQNLYSGGHFDNQQLEKKVKQYQSIPNVETQYCKLVEKADDISLTNLSRPMAAYVRAVVFLTFLAHMSCCNPALSFYVFECMTGYLGLFGAKAEDCIYGFDRRNEEDIFLRITNEDNAVIHFAKEIISDFQTVKVRRSEKYADSRNEEDLPLSLCYFIANFQRKLAPDAQDKKGHLEVLRALSELSPDNNS